MILRLSCLRSCASSYLNCRGGDHALPHWVLSNHKPRFYIVCCSRIGTLPLHKGALVHSPRMQQSHKPIVRIDAARLDVESVLLIALFGEVLLDGPRPRPNGRIFDRDLVLEGVRPGALPALDEMQILP